jgi:uncharacterized protein (DUF427 family)
MSVKLALALHSRSETPAPAYLSNNYITRASTMRAVWKGVTIAESKDTVVVEGNHYFPLESIVPEYFEETDHQTSCHWKGTASYYSVVVAGETNDNAAWYYKQPKPDASQIKGRVAFWRGVEVTD